MGLKVDRRDDIRCAVSSARPATASRPSTDSTERPLGRQEQSAVELQGVPGRAQARQQRRRPLRLTIGKPGFRRRPSEAGCAGPLAGSCSTAHPAARPARWGRRRSLQSTRMAGRRHRCCPRPRSRTAAPSRSRWCRAASASSKWPPVACSMAPASHRAGANSTRAHSSPSRAPSKAQSHAARGRGAGEGACHSGCAAASARRQGQHQRAFPQAG